MIAEVDLIDLWRITQVLQHSPELLGRCSLNDILYTYYNPVISSKVKQPEVMPAIKIGDIFKVGTARCYKVLSVKEKNVLIQQIYVHKGKPIPNEIVSVPFYKRIKSDNTIIFGNEIARLWDGQQVSEPAVKIEPEPVNKNLFTIGSILRDSEKKFYQIIDMDETTAKFSLIAGSDIPLPFRFINSPITRNIWDKGIKDNGGNFLTLFSHANDYTADIIEKGMLFKNQANEYFQVIHVADIEGECTIKPIAVENGKPCKGKFIGGSKVRAMVFGVIKECTGEYLEYVSD